jgi:hypothetical protein
MQGEKGRQFDHEFAKIRYFQPNLEENMKKYYVHDGQRERGPFSIEELSSELIDKETPVWYEGLESWTLAGNVAELKYLFEKPSQVVPPPLPKELGNREPEKKLPVLPKTDGKHRHEILKTFEDATEGYLEPIRKSYAFPIILGILVFAAIIVAFFYLHKFK